MIKLSASSISDYLECPQRFWYRLHKKSEAVKSDHMILGSIIHEAIEKNGNLDNAVIFAENQWAAASGSFMGEVPKPPKNIEKLLKGYYDKILPKLDEENAEKELFFEEPWGEVNGENVVIIGKIDRISGNSIYDWKTGSRRPSEYVRHDIQFYLYAWAYEQMYGEPPEHVYYGHLYTGSLYDVELKGELVSNMHNLIEKVANEFHDDPVRITGYQCGRCIYKDICYRELDENELASGTVH